MVSRLSRVPAFSVISPVVAVIPLVASTVPTVNPCASENWKLPALVPASVVTTLEALSVTAPPETTFKPVAVMIPLALLVIPPTPACNETGPAGEPLFVVVIAELSASVFAAASVIGLPPRTSDTMGWLTVRLPTVVVMPIGLGLPLATTPLNRPEPMVNACPFLKPSAPPPAIFADRVFTMLVPSRLAPPGILAPFELPIFKVAAVIEPEVFWKIEPPAFSQTLLVADTVPEAPKAMFVFAPELTA